MASKDNGNLVHKLKTHANQMKKLKLEQDVTGEVDADSKTKKEDVARLLKVALGVELKEKQIEGVGKVYTEL
jgi:hypothetical protein